MKKIAFVLLVMVSTFAGAQQLTQQNTQPQINVAGEGKVTVAPDEAKITIGVENSGADAAEVKKKNDAAVDAVLKYLKNTAKLAEKDYQTKRVSLYRNQDYKTKKYTFYASQTITIHLRDLSKYDAIVMGVVDAGANTIQGVEFLTSKLAQYQSEARIKAVQDAKQKATDYATALGQKAGKAILVTDNTQTYYPSPVMMNARFKAEADAVAPNETLAVGEITITANVNISYSLE